MVLSRRWLSYGLIFLFMGLFVGVGIQSITPVMAKSKKMTVKDVLVLLQIGYKEPAILAEIQKRGMTKKFGVTTAQARELSQAGASMRLIGVMGFAKKRPSPVSLEELQGWLQQKKPEAWIKQELQRRGVVAKQFSMAAVLTLREKGMSLQLLRFVVQLKAKPKPAVRPILRMPTARPAVRLSTGRPVVRRAVPRLMVPPVRRVVPRPMVPPVRRTPGTQPALRIPFPIDPRPPVVRKPPVRRPSVSIPKVKTTRWGVKPKQVQPLSEFEKKGMKRLGVRVPVPKDGIYRHLSGSVQLKVPKGWNIVKDIDPGSGGVHIYITPEQTLEVTQIKQSFGLSMEYLSQGDRSGITRSLQQTARFLTQRYLMKELGVTEKEKLKEVVLRGHKAIRMGLEGKARLDVHTLRKRFYLLQTKDYILQVNVQSPPKQFSAFAKRANELLNSLTFLRSDQKISGTRHATAITAQKVIQKNISGVVSVMCMSHKKGKLTPASSGSGFVVTSDGYVLTNHHVAVNSHTGKSYAAYYLNWDSTTGRKFAKARFVAAYKKQAERGRVRIVDPKTGRISVRFQRQHVDIALLKIIKPGVYPTVPLSSVKRAMLGDQVIAMGFPSEGASINHMGNESITTTIGVISRLVRLADKRVNEIQHSAKVAGGNSGGPLFDVHTGAVIGINTWVGIFDKRLPRPGMGLGYYYAIPIDLAWQYFPDFIDPKAKSYTAEQWYSLGLKWLAAEQWDPARRAFLRVIQRKPTLTVAHLQMSSLYLARATKHSDDRRQGWLQVSRRWADQGLRKELKHPGLMMLLARISIEQKDWNTSKYLLQQLVNTNPFDWQVFVLRAVMHNQQGHHKLALQDARRVIQLAGKLLPSGHLLRGMILYSMKRYFEGQQAYRMALQIDPTHLRAQLQEAMAYAYLKQFDDALSRLKQLVQQRKYESSIYGNLMFTYATKGDYPLAWKAFNAMWRTSMLRQQKINAYSLYMGGLLAQRVLSAKIRGRLKWGLWGTVIGSHNLASIAQTVGIYLALNALKKGYRGLAYALIQRVKTPIEHKKIAANYKKLLQRLPRRGISQQAWLYVTTRAYPRWSSQLVWKLFLSTPSILELRTAKLIAKRGFSIPLLIKMLALSKQRQAQGVKANSPKTLAPQSNKHTFQRHRAMVISTVLLVFKSLREGNIHLWMAQQHPAVDRRQRAQIFRTMIMRLRNGSISMTSYNPYKVKIQRHPQYGLIAQYFFKLRVHQKRFKRFWRLRFHQGKWKMF